MAGIGKLAKLIKTAEKGLQATRKNAGKLVQTTERNGQKIEIYQKKVGKYNPFRRTKTVTTRFVEGEETATRVTVQRQKGSVFQTHTQYADGRSATSLVNVKKGEQTYIGPNISFTKEAREGLAKTHKDNFIRNWAIGGTGAIAIGATAYALSGDDKEVKPAPTDSTKIAPAPTDSTKVKPAPTAPVQQTPPANNIFGGVINGITKRNITIKEGDCLWNIAKRDLQAANPGKTITNAQILKQVKEFGRLNPEMFGENPSMNKLDLIFPDKQLKLSA